MMLYLLRRLTENNRSKIKKLFYKFVDLEKALK